MSRVKIIILISLAVLVACAKSSVNEEVDSLTDNALNNKDLFSLSPSGDVPVVDEDGYWIFGLFINNFTDSKIKIDMSENLKLYYKNGDRWYETGNHEVIYQNEWQIPPNTIESYPWYLFIRPSLQREDITLRVFVIGTIENGSNEKLVGMVEYIIKDNNLELINTINKIK